MLPLQLPCSVPQVASRVVRRDSRFVKRSSAGCAKYVAKLVIRHQNEVDVVPA